MISTVGPYARYGTPLVESAIRQGTHYVDLTGETPWVRSLIDRLHGEAEAKGVKIVPSCGYDSIPSDLGAWFAARELQRRYPGCRVGRISCLVAEGKGGFSGGTIESG